MRIRFLERVTTAAEERHFSQNTLTAYRRTWLKLIAWAAAEGLALETLPSDINGTARDSFGSRSEPRKLNITL